MTKKDVSRTLVATRGLTRLITDGELRAGDRVSQVRIASLLDVDRASVQLAFERLRRQGVLESSTHRGFVVRSFTLPQVEDVIFLRGRLEGAAARLATQRKSVDGVRALVACVTGLDQVVEDTDHEAEVSLRRYRELNDAFHAELFALADSDFLTDAYESLVALPFAQPSALLVYGTEHPILSVPIQFAQVQHRKILKAIKAGDSEGAELLARQHADLARHDLRAVMRRGAAIGMLPGSGLIVSTEGRPEAGAANEFCVPRSISRTGGAHDVTPEARAAANFSPTTKPVGMDDQMGLHHVVVRTDGYTQARDAPVSDEEQALARGRGSEHGDLEHDNHRPGVQVISRVSLILRILTNARTGLTLAEVVTRSGLPKTTAYRILSALQDERLVESVDGRYGVGRVLGPDRTAETEQARVRVRPLMERVAAEVQETVDLTILVEDQVMIVEQIVRRRAAMGGPVVGSRLPALGTASGLALLACSPSDERSELAFSRAGLSHGDSHEGLAERLEQVRREGIAVSMNDIPGILTMATAATDQTGLAFALGVPVPSDRSAHQAPLIRDTLLRARPEFERLICNN